MTVYYWFLVEVSSCFGQVKHRQVICSPFGESMVRDMFADAFQGTPGLTVKLRQLEGDSNETL